MSGFSYPLSIVSQPAQLSLRPSIPLTNALLDREFVFLNKSFVFLNKIDWNFSTYGKLWTYNLTYFEYLNQSKMQQDEGLLLIKDFIDQMLSVKDGLESFPIALRGVNWIKFLTKYEIRDQKIDDSLYAQYKILLDNLEYHLLGNHLLENGFSLLFGAYYFKDEELYTKAKEILITELDEQVLRDGAHFELSPMYHQIMLLRLLDSINLVQNNSWKKSDLLTLLKDKASLMLGWLNAIAFDDGTIPLLNDSSFNITPTTNELNLYAEQLKVKKGSVILKESGYRKVKKDRYECIIDVGNIGPDYIPGHAHSDTFNFIMHVDGKPLIVDTGLSTYETNQRRMIERSTSAHNTVEVDGLNQSEVWGGFRVARRAKIIHLDENSHIIEATHDGYKRIGVLHTRKFTVNERSIVIEDYINSASKHQCIAYIHFHPKVRPVIKDNKIIIDQTGIIIDNAIKIEIGAYQYAPEFNKLNEAVSVKIAFENRLKMEIQIS
ncbi:alginate lyase family protein [Sulfurimonas sp. HSL3-7]|uniref:alginate lyase family protein n=1 Tax=Sulfonitrofixus jiaomeiensis TaxID=3131938 RepID=UPI0031F765AA